MNVPDTYSELQEAVEYMESHGLEDDAQCVALREILDAADKLARNSDHDAVDAALQACRECVGTHASKDEYVNLLADSWSEYSDVEDYAMQMFECTDETIPDFVKYHVDWESCGRELLQDESIYTFYENRLYIFCE